MRKTNPFLWTGVSPICGYGSSIVHPYPAAVKPGAQEAAKDTRLLERQKMPGPIDDGERRVRIAVKHVQLLHVAADPVLASRHDANVMAIDRSSGFVVQHGGRLHVLEIRLVALRAGDETQD